MADPSTVLIVAGGDPPGATVLRGFEPAAVFAADGGLDTCRAMGLTVDRVIGDLDSVSSTALDWARTECIPIETHRVDKDETDLELAMRRAASAGIERIVVVGIGGGRVDHLLANLLLLGSDAFAGLVVEARLETDRIVIVRPGGAALEGSPGDVVSLLPLGGRAEGIVTSGLRWPIDDGTLEAGEPRGISNLVTAPSFSVDLRAGRLAVIHLDAYPHAG